jgi:hypothetical protein
MTQKSSQLTNKKAESYGRLDEEAKALLVFQTFKKKVKING